MRRLALILALTLPAAAQTTVSISNTVKQANEPRPGINMGFTAAYGAFQTLKSLNQANGGYFPSGYWATSFTCNTGGTNDTTHWYFNGTGLSGNSYPANFWVGATAIAYNASTGASYGSTTITASSAQSTSAGIQFTFSPAISSTCNTSNQDMLAVRLNAATSLTAPANYLSTCSGATFVQGDTSPASNNTTQSLELPTGGCNLNFGIDQNVGNQTNTNSSLASSPQNFLNLNGSYTATFKAKCLTASCGLTYLLQRQASGGATFASGSVSPTYNTTPGAGWTTYNFSFTASENGTQGPGQVAYNFTSSGTVLIQDVDVIEGSTLSGNTSPFRDAVVRRLRALNVGSLRWMQGSDWCSDVADQIKPVGANRWCGVTTSQLNGGLTGGFGYTAELQLCALVNADCWISVGQFNQPSDWTTLVNWLNTQGWISTFSAAGHNIYLEEGNEAWNTGAYGGLWAGGGVIYGTVSAANMAASRAASGYNGSVIRLVQNGFSAAGQCGTNGNNGWCSAVLLEDNNYQTANPSSNPWPDFLDGATYMFGGGLQYFQTSGANLSPTGAPFVDESAEITNWTSSSPPSGSTSIYTNSHYLATQYPSHPVANAVYESNYGGLNGTTATQLQLNQYAASVGEGLFQAEMWLLDQRDAGITGPINVFDIGQPYEQYNNSQPPVTPLYGTERYMACGPGQMGAGACSDVGRPIDIAMQVVNNAIGSNNNLMSTTQSSTPTFSYTTNANGIQSNASVPYVNCFSFANSGLTNWTTLCFNNNLSSSESVTLSGAGAPSGSVTQTVYPNSGNAITDNNENSYIGPSSISPVVTVPSPTSTSGTSYTIPPASMIALTYSTAATVATPTFTAQSGSAPQNISITDTTAGATIYYTTDGSTPTTSSAVYLGVPIYVWQSQTLKAIGVLSGFANSAVGSASYTIAAQKTRFSVMRSASNQTVTPTPLDDRPLPSTGCEAQQIEPSSGTYSFTNCDKWFASAKTNGWNLTFTHQSRPAWMTGLAANTDGPSSDWNTPTSCGTVQGIVLGIIPDCQWVTYMINFMYHYQTAGYCPQLNYAEAGNEVNGYSGSSILVGWSASPDSFAQTAIDTAYYTHQFCPSTLNEIGNFSAVVGANATGNPEYDVYAAAILTAIAAKGKQNLFQGIDVHTYPGRDNVVPVQPPTSNVSYSSSLCTSGNTPNNSCRNTIATQISTLQANALNQAGTKSWSGNLPVITDEGGYNKVVGLNGDLTYGSAWISEYIPLIAAQGEEYNMLYLANDVTNGSPCTSNGQNWGCYGVSPFYTATNQSILWMNAATSIGTATTASITGGTMWTVPLDGGTSAIVWCAVQDPATCTTTTSYDTQQDISGTISATGGHLTLSSTAEKVYTSASHILTVSSAGTGSGTISGTNCATGTYGGSTVVTCSASPAIGSTFTGWSGTGSASGCTGTGGCSFTLSANSTVTATFNVLTYTLTGSVVGSGTLGGTNCSSGTNTYNYGTTITCTPTPAGGWLFTGWSGGTCSGTGGCSFAITANATVTATFALAPVSNVTVSGVSSFKGTVIIK